MPRKSSTIRSGRALNAALRSEYGRLTGTSAEALTLAIEPYLPIVRVLALLGETMPVLREQLIQRTEAALLSPD